MSEGLRPAQAAFKVVDNAPEPGLGRGKALVFGHFPPVSTSSSQAAAAELWMLEAHGHAVRSVTGPGLSLAAQNVNFTSESRFGASTAFLKRLPGDGLAVVHARALEFARIAKPTWYKRRMEELRRMRLLARIVGKHSHTVLVLDGRSVFSRETAALMLGAMAGALLRRRRLSVHRRASGALAAFASLTGAASRMPRVHEAEERAYRAAFEGTGRQAIRLTAPRAEQIARFSVAKNESRQSARLLEDVVLLSEIAQRHDLRESPLFRLVENAGPVPDGPVGPPAGPALEAAHKGAGAHKFHVPLTRYMEHLRQFLGIAKAFPLSSRAEARRFLTWYTREAAAQTPGGWVPVSAQMRRFLREEAGLRPALCEGAGLAHMHGHDARPFALSDELTALYLANEVYHRGFDIEDPVDRLGFVARAIVEAEDGADVPELIGPAARKWFREPVGGIPGNLSRFVFLMAIQARFELSGQDQIDAPWASEAVRDWSQIVLRDRLPTTAALLGTGKASARRAEAASVRLVGLPKSGTGVGSNLLMSRAAFRKLGLEPEVRDLADGLAAAAGPFGEEGGSIGPNPAPTREALERPLVLHHVNADRVPQAMLSLPMGGRADTAHIGFLLWEFGVLPREHQLALEMLEEIWVPSRFVQESYGQAAPVSVVNMGKAIVLPQVEKADLARFGVPAGARTFLTCFDFHSSVQRKNPLAVVEAFLEAFAGQSDVCLIVKTTPPAAGHWGDGAGQWARIEALAARDARIILCTERLAFADLVALVAAADCLVSAHRAEGFGLLPAYALAQATPVIATDYSGTRDFCTQATAMPVPYKLVPVPPRDALFAMEGAQWAEIDKAALVAAMSAFAQDPMDGRLRAARGRKLIAQEYSVASQAARYRRRLEALGLIAPDAACPGAACPGAPASQEQSLPDARA